MDEDETLAETQGEEAVPTEEVVVEAENTEPQPISVDDLATEMGWTPQDKWKGDPEKWKPSSEFMRHTVDVNRNLSGKLKGLEDQVSNMARTSAQVAELAVARERERLMAERQEAFDVGDSDAFNAADRKLVTIPAVAPVAPPEAQEFVKRNAWFNQDQEATAWAINRAEELHKQGLGTARQLAIVEREAKNMFPELFEETPKSKAAPLNRPGNRGAAVQAKGFSTLPDDVKAAAQDYAKRGVCTTEEYAKIYYEQGAGA